MPDNQITYVHTYIDIDGSAKKKKNKQKFKYASNNK